MRKTKYADRSIPKISLHDFEERIGEITEQLVHSAETDGFFVLVNHGIDLSTISQMFETSKKFFSLLSPQNLSFPSLPSTTSAGNKIPKCVLQPALLIKKNRINYNSTPRCWIIGSMKKYCQGLGKK
ncbi:hypothetical protein DID88_010211 [Monilinia fructigena]|uniref:Non-haem dioxygenase N-terminal domain-containing protein n=1 Tax=Monilinia fructigena TaxID=38457 RepID=A0A395IL61_9HELO|nr:hypothetical protein DID88_010211 [Monilinia fructigena]